MKINITRIVQEIGQAINNNETVNVSLSDAATNNTAKDMTPRDTSRLVASCVTIDFTSPEMKKAITEHIMKTFMNFKHTEDITWE